MDCFPDKLYFEDAGLRGTSRLFQLVSSFRYVSSYGTVTVPAGFITDGASIPQVFWSILSPFGGYFSAAVVHDFLYSPFNDTRFTRQQADLIFKEAMFNIGVSWYQREIIFRAVRVFGRFSYKGSKE
jgi:hypothetical protein